MPFTIIRYDQYDCERDGYRINHVSMSRHREQLSFIEKYVIYLLQLGVYNINSMLGVHLKELLKSTIEWSGKLVQLMLSTPQHFLGGDQYEEV